MPSYTTEWIRSEDLKPGDVAKINGTWSFVFDCYGEADLGAVEDELGADPVIVQKITGIVSKRAPDNSESVYVAVRYLYTATSSYPGPEYRYRAVAPCVAVAAYSVYELIEVQRVKES